MATTADYCAGCTPTPFDSVDPVTRAIVYGLRSRVGLVVELAGPLDVLVQMVKQHLPLIVTLTSGMISNGGKTVTIDTVGGRPVANIIHAQFNLTVGEDVTQSDNAFTRTDGGPFVADKKATFYFA